MSRIEAPYVPVKVILRLKSILEALHILVPEKFSGYYRSFSEPQQY